MPSILFVTEIGQKKLNDDECSAVKLLCTENYRVLATTRLTVLLAAFRLSRHSISLSLLLSPSFAKVLHLAQSRLYLKLSLRGLIGLKGFLSSLGVPLPKIMIPTVSANLMRLTLVGAGLTGSSSSPRKSSHLRFLGCSVTLGKSSLPFSGW